MLCPYEFSVAATHKKARLRMRSRAFSCVCHERPRSFDKMEPLGNGVGALFSGADGGVGVDGGVGAGDAKTCVCKLGAGRGAKIGVAAFGEVAAVEVAAIEVAGLKAPFFVGSGKNVAARRAKSLA